MTTMMMLPSKHCATAPVLFIPLPHCGTLRKGGHELCTSSLLLRACWFHGLSAAACFWRHVPACRTPRCLRRFWGFLCLFGAAFGHPPLRRRAQHRQQMCLTLSFVSRPIDSRVLDSFCLSLLHRLIEPLPPSPISRPTQFAQVSKQQQAITKLGRQP